MNNTDCVLITGGSRGIGRSAALEFARETDLHILINYSSDDKAANESAGLIRSAGASVELLKFDVANAQQAEDVLGNWQAQNKDKFIKILVNNAGVSQDSLFHWMQKEQWDRVIDITLKGFYILTKLVLPEMMKHKNGRIINVSSVSGQMGLPGQVNYSTAKAGIIGATKALARELGRMNITVNAVAPGYISTEMVDDVDSARIKREVPLARMGEPEEVAALIAFLASDKASYITGAVMSINGGMYE